MEECGTKRSFVLTEQSLFVLTEGYVVKKGCVCMCVCVCVCVRTLSGVRLCVTPWTVACQAPLSMGFSRQEYWSG